MVLLALYPLLDPHLLALEALLTLYIAFSSSFIASLFRNFDKDNPNPSFNQFISSYFHHQSSRPYTDQRDPGEVSHSASHDVDDDDDGVGDRVF